MSQGSTIASKGGIVSGPNTNKIGCNSNSTEMWTILKIKSGASKKGYEDINSLELKPVGVYHGIVLGDVMNQSGEVKNKLMSVE
jgi:hypothetical protein